MCHLRLRVEQQVLARLLSAGKLLDTPTLRGRISVHKGVHLSEKVKTGDYSSSSTPTASRSGMIVSFVVALSVLVPPSKGHWPI